MLYHHSKAPYAIEAQRCSELVRKKFEKQIEAGHAQAQHTIAMLQNNPPQDNFIWHDDMVFDIDEGKVTLQDRKKPEHVFTMHPNAVSQAANTEGVQIPKRYLDRLIEDHQDDLAALNLNTRFNNLPILEKTKKPRRFNARAVNTQVRGLVSDAFARWDTNTLVESFIGAVMKRGGVMISAKYTELQFSLKAVRPVLFEPALGEVMLFGIGFRRSDFGLSPLCMEGVCNRPICTNLATTESVFTRRNISVRYNDAEMFKQETMDKETSAHASAIGDLVDKYLSDEYLGIQVQMIHKAMNTEIKSLSEAIDSLKKGKITAEEAEMVKTYYENKDEELLPAGNTAWRLSNALSLLSQTVAPDRGFELEQVAGDVAGLRAF